MFDYNSLSAISLSVFLSSLLGSIHCMGMCGPIVMVLEQKKRKTWPYHLGRLIGYLLLAVIVSLLGQAVLLSFQSLIQIPLAPIFLGLSFCTLGLMLFMGRSFHFHFFEGLSHKMGNVLTKDSWWASFVVGFSAILLPCGWLYGFVVGAGSSADLITALVIMFSFWLGTVPFLYFSPKLLNQLLKKSKIRPSWISGSILIIMGIILVATSLWRNYE